MAQGQVWLADFRKLAEALKPFVLTDGDFTYISDGAPEDLVRPSRRRRPRRASARLVPGSDGLLPWMALDGSG